MILPARISSQKLSQSTDSIVKIVPVEELARETVGSPPLSSFLRKREGLCPASPVICLNLMPFKISAFVLGVAAVWSMALVLAIEVCGRVQERY